MTRTALCVACVGWMVGRPRIEALAVVVAVAAPLPALALVAVARFLAARVGGGRIGRSPDVAVLLRLTGDLRSGESVRSAIHGVASTEPRFARAARLAEAGRPMSEVAQELAGGFDRLGPVVGAALQVSSSTGGSSARALEELAGQALALDDLERERRSAMAPALLQAVIVGGVPLVALLWMLVTGRLMSMIAAGPIQASLAVLGSLSTIVGTGVVVWMVRRL